MSNKDNIEPKKLNEFKHTGFGDCCCDDCFPPEQTFPLANHGKPMSLLRSLLVVLKEGVRFYH